MTRVYEYPAYRITARAELVGGDLLVRISGGDRPHIGSVAAAQPRESLREGGDPSATVSVFNYPGHLDDALALPAAKLLCSRAGVRTVVVCGVHYDDPSPALLEEVPGLAERIAADILQDLRG